MTSKEHTSKEDKGMQTLEEICENSRAIRRVVNRILDHLHEHAEERDDYDPDTVGWQDFYANDDMYY